VTKTMKDDIITTREMQALDMNAEYFGISRLQLMENAGRNVTVEVSSRFKPQDTRVAIFCGLGGNGGDGFVAARHLACLGFKVDVILAGQAAQITDDEARKNWQALESLKDYITLHEAFDSSIVPDVKAEVLVDALLGTGLKGPPRPPVLQLIKRINEADAFRVAVDLPSGIDSDSGEVLGEAVKADLTVTFHKAKPGLVKVKEHVGELVVKHIGLPQEVERFAGPGDVSIVVKPRPPESHKGDFGRLLVVGGNETYSGAPTLTALAALRTGVDLAFIAAPRDTAYSISAMSPDLITVKLEGEHLNMGNLSVLRHHLERATAVAIGPGLGLHKETQEAVKEIVGIAEAKKIPMLLDADGLKAFAEFKHRIETRAVLTPHAGEYQMLTGKKLPLSLEERADSVRRTAQNLDTVILLKSHVDVISNGYKVKLNFTGNPGMTVGGTGDVLSGIVAAFLAQGVDPFEAAVAGAFINGAAGDFVKAEKGYHMVSTDLLEWIPKIIDNPMCHADLREGYHRGVS